MLYIGALVYRKQWGKLSLHWLTIMNCIFVATWNPNAYICTRVASQSIYTCIRVFRVDGRDHKLKHNSLCWLATMERVVVGGTSVHSRAGSRVTLFWANNFQLTTTRRNQSNTFVRATHHLFIYEYHCGSKDWFLNTNIICTLPIIDLLLYIASFDYLWSHIICYDIKLPLTKFCLAFLLIRASENQ